MDYIYIKKNVVGCNLCHPHSKKQTKEKLLFKEEQCYSAGRARVIKVCFVTEP